MRVDNQKGMIMHACINVLAKNLNLSSYQINKIKNDYDKYNIARLEKRGGVLYAPYVVHGIQGWIARIFLGTTADLIGQDKTLLRAQRNIRFCANGYHCVRIGMYTYYANATGHVVSKQEFMRETKF